MSHFYLDRKSSAVTRLLTRNSYEDVAQNANVPQHLGNNAYRRYILA